MGRVLLVLMFAVPVFAGCVPPKVDGARELSADELLAAGHALRVRAMLEAAQDANPLLLSRAQSALGDLDAALKTAEAALAANPAGADAHVQMASVIGQMAEKASMFKQLGLARRAKKELDAALTLDSKNLDALYGLMLYSYAAPSFIGGDKAKAQVYAEAMTAINAARGYLAQARLAKERKDPAKEEEFYRKAVAADPGFYEGLATFSRFYLTAAAPDYDKAEKYACDALALDPQRAEAWKILAEIRAESQCWNELDELLTAAEAAIPDDLSPYYASAVVFLKHGTHSALAEEYLLKYESRAIEANEPSAAYAHYQRALALEKLARTEEASAELQTALEVEPAFDLPKQELKKLANK